VVIEAGRQVHVINRVNVDEVCIAPVGANPDAVVWLDCEPVDELPAYVAAARQQWHAGLPRAQKPVARAPRITARARSRAPASVLRVLADPQIAAMFRR
jgi:hypothetical protein